MECRSAPKNTSEGTSPFTGKVTLLGSVNIWMRIRKSLCCYTDFADQAREVPLAEVGFWWRSLCGHPGFVKLSYGLRQICLITWTQIFYLTKCRHVCASQLLSDLLGSSPSLPNVRAIYSHRFSLVLIGFKWYLLFLLQDGFCLRSPPLPKIRLVCYPTLKQNLLFILWAILRFYFLLSCGWTVDSCVAVRGAL